MKDLKILSEESSYAGYKIPEQAIAATEEQEKIVQRPESIRVFRKAMVDPHLKQGGDKALLAHPRMTEAPGRVFQVVYNDGNNKEVKTMLHESKIPADVIADFENPDDDEEELDMDQISRDMEQAEKLETALTEATQAKERESKAKAEAAAKQKELEAMQKRNKELEKKLAEASAAQAKGNTEGTGTTPPAPTTPQQ